MKMLYEQTTGLLLDPAYVLIGDVDPLVHRTSQEQTAEILSQNRPLLQKDAVDGETGQERFGVWICYVTDNHGDPIIVKLVSTDVQAMEWNNGRPRTIGVMDDETRGNRFVEYHTVEVERP